MATRGCVSRSVMAAGLAVCTALPLTGLHAQQPAAPPEAQDSGLFQGRLMDPSKLGDIATGVAGARIPGDELADAADGEKRGDSDGTSQEGQEDTALANAGQAAGSDPLGLPKLREGVSLQRYLNVGPGLGALPRPATDIVPLPRTE